MLGENPFKENKTGQNIDQTTGANVIGRSANDPSNKT